MDYTTLTLTHIRAALDDIARETQETFGALDARQLNWRPDATSWSVGQCFDHLVTSNRLMLQQAEAAIDASKPKSVWQRLPVVPRVLGQLMIRSLTPNVTRKFKTPSLAVPATSDIPLDILERFAEQQRNAAIWMRSLDERESAAIMTSPFAKMITYSVLDGCRIIATHNRRHFEQARRVTALPNFPRATPA
jgi:hypothetical protein